MKLDQYLQNFKQGQPCTVNGNRVWDYKLSEDGSEIRLISEQVHGSDSFEDVYPREISEYVGLFTGTVDVVDETTGKLVKHV